MRTWVNGRLLEDPREPVLDVTDHGLTVGDGVFEVAKVVDGEPFALTRHLCRLRRSAEAIGLTPVGEDAVRAGVAAVLEAEHLPLGRLRITHTAGPSPLGSGRSEGDGQPTLVVVGVPMDPAEPSVAVHTVPWPRNERGALAGVKSTSYAENALALARAHEAGASEALFANLAGHLCEGTGSNVGYVVGGEVRTPTLESGCLAGITRALVCEWYDVTQVDAPMGVLQEADEVFLMSTTRDVQPVIRIDDRELSVGPVTREVQRAWAEGSRQGMDP